MDSPRHIFVMLALPLWVMRFMPKTKTIIRCRYRKIEITYRFIQTKSDIIINKIRNTYDLSADI
jgi:hypothetical protein